MSEALLAEFFLEDTAHRKFLIPLVERVGREEEVDLRCRVRNARGGHAGVMGSFERYQILRERGVGGSEAPDLLLVAMPAPTRTSSVGIWPTRSRSRPSSGPSQG